MSHRPLPRSGPRREIQAKTKKFRENPPKHVTGRVRLVSMDGSSAIFQTTTLPTDMKITASQFLATLGALAATAGSAFSAVVIYSDDFTSGTNGSLNGQAPQVRPTTEIWNSTTWNKNTSGGGTANSSGSGSAVLPAPTFGAGDVYTITVRLYNNLASSSSNWVAFGFTTGTVGVYSGANVGMYWMLWRGTDELRALENGANFVGPSVSPTGENNELDARMVYDVDEDMMSWFYKNPSATEWTLLHSMTPSQSRIDSINNVGLSANSTNVGALSFELVSIPEPATALFGSLGLLALLRRRR